MIQHLTALPRQVAPPLRLAGRAVPLAALALCLWVMAGQLGRVDGASVLAAITAIGPGPLCAALVMTAISLAAVGGFERTVRRMIGLTGATARDLRAGIAAVAIAQVAGFGALTASLARWRALPELGLPRATELSLAVSLSFMAALSVLAAVAVSLAQGLVGLTLGLAALLVALMLRLTPGPRLPGLTPARGLHLVLWTLADTSAGALVLFVLLPPDATLGAVPFLAAYLAALVAGFLSQSPGGLGAFDLAFLAMVPGLPQDAVLAALLMYRLIYHVLPACIALLMLARPGRRPAPVALQPARGAGLQRALAQAPSGDWALVHQDATVLLQKAPLGGWLTAPAGGWLVGLGDPLGQVTAQDLALAARAAGRAPALYRIGPRAASAARHTGWTVMRLASEAWITPATWQSDAPACRGLRRKLRQAAGTDLRIEVEPAYLPLRQMAALSAGWAARQGGERGFSMGRFSPELVQQAVVALAWRGPYLVAFLTFNRGRHCWTLDLMRHGPDAPDGTMHVLVTAAIAAARAAGVPRLSLACVPCPPAVLPQALARRVIRPGLHQFKSAFAPRWSPRYLATPSRAHLPLALAAIVRAIHRPAPLHPGNRPALSGPPMPFGFDSPPVPCECPDPNATPAPALRRAHPPESRPHDQRPFPPA